MKTATFLIDTLLGFAVIVLVPFAWIMRDGMGPDAVDSVGLSAVVRCFMTFCTGPIVLTLAVLSLGFHLAIREHTK